MEASPSSCVTVESEDSSSSCVTDEGKSRKRVMSNSRARDASMSIWYPMFEGNNYGVWVTKMKNFMHSHGVREIVEGDNDDDPRLL